MLLTGPTRGLGLDATRSLARRGVGLVLLGRPSTAFDDVVKEAERAGARQAIPVAVDLASIESTRQAIVEVSALIGNGTVNAFDAMVLNAGLQVSDGRQSSVDGLELTFAVNVLSTHQLIVGVLPLLAPDAHTVIVGSGTHFGKPPATVLVAAPVWRDPVELANPGRDNDANASSSRAGQRAYSTSKLCVNYLAHELNRRAGEQTRVTVYDPGLMPGTGLARTAAPWRQFVWSRIMPAFRVLPGVTTTGHSGEILAQLTVGELHPDERNAYVEIGKVTKASDASFDPIREAALWAWCTDRLAV